MKWNNAILGAVNEKHWTSNGGCKVHIWKSIPGEGASALEDYSIYGEEGGVEDESPDGMFFLGGAGGEVAGGTGSEGSAVEDDGGGGDLEDRSEVGEGGGDVGEAIVFRGISLIRRQPIPRIIIRKYIHTQHLGQKFTPRINIPQIFRIGMTIQNGGSARSQSPAPRARGHGDAHFQFFGGAYLWCGGDGRPAIGVVVIVVVSRSSRLGSSSRAAAPHVVVIGFGRVVLVVFAREGGPHSRAGAFVLGAFDEEGGDAFAKGVGEPYDLGFLEAGGGRGLEEEGGDGVPHIVFGLLSDSRYCCCCVWSRSLSLFAVLLDPSLLLLLAAPEGE
mmetsp:Transcript_18877/g.39727  ORF Transcript_18877/g.39727 Transcript_18877/m.39727 type:complete len:331 (+) Transcript_18877:669-1661(+)